MGINQMCDGSHCKNEHGEVKLYPIGGEGNMILCVVCWANENRSNFNRLKTHRPADPDCWPQHNWFNADTYDSNEKAHYLVNERSGKRLWRSVEKELGNIHKK